MRNTTSKRYLALYSVVLPFRTASLCKGENTCTSMRLASILNCREPVLGGAQNSSEWSSFTIVSDSCSHCLLLEFL